MMVGGMLIVYGVVYLIFEEQKINAAMELATAHSSDFDGLADRRH